MDGEAAAERLRIIRITDGEWAGWRSFGEIDPFEAQVGPFYFRKEPDGRMRTAFRAERRHMNGGGFMHGGCLMTFADFALFVIAHEVLKGSWAVTATFNAEFLGSVQEGALLEGAGEVVKAGRSLVFVRGLVVSGEAPVLSFSAALKKTAPKA
jgi:uncharacterized protein (TIGR00369 family)